MSNEGVTALNASATMEGEDLRAALQSALASAYENGSLQRILHEVLEAPKPRQAPEAAVRAAGVGVDDLLADFDSPRDPTSDAAEVSFDLSDSPSNEESGGFFISTGGGGLNLPLDDDDDAFKERQDVDADAEDLTEETRRVYLSGDDRVPSEPSKAATATDLVDSLEVSAASLEPPIAPPEEVPESAVTTQRLPIEVVEEKAPDPDPREEMLIRLHDQLLAKQSVMQCVLKGLLNVQAREVKALKAEALQTVEEETKASRVEEVPTESLDEQADQGTRGRDKSKGSKSLTKKRRTMPANVRTITTLTSTAGEKKASSRQTMPSPRAAEGFGAAPKRRTSAPKVPAPERSAEGGEISSRPSSRSSQRDEEGVERPEDGNSDERPENAQVQGNEATEAAEGQESLEAAETGAPEEMVDHDDGIGVCEVSEAEFQLLFDAGVLYQAYGFYPQQHMGFSFNIPSFGETPATAQVPEQTNQDWQDWYQAQAQAQAAQAVAPEAYQYQQYYQQALPGNGAAQAAQYQYPYYQQGMAQYAAPNGGQNAMYGAPPPYQNQMMRQTSSSHRPPSQQASGQSTGQPGAEARQGRRQNAQRSESPAGEAEVSDEGEAENDKEAESPKDGAKNPKKAKGKAAAKTLRKKPVEKPPVDKGPKCQLFFLPLDTLQNWKKGPEGHKDEHHDEEHGSMSEVSQASHSEDGQEWAMSHHWTDSHAAHGVHSDFDGNHEDPLDGASGDIVAGSGLNSARHLKSARTMPDRTPSQPEVPVVQSARPPGNPAPSKRRPQPNVVFTGDN